MAHGETRFHRQAECLLQSLQAWANTSLGTAKLELGVVTDDPKRWTGQGYVVIPVSRTQIEDWIRASGFTHIVKVHIFEWVFNLGYERAVFMDADMFATGKWMRPLEAIDAQTVVMERLEGALSGRYDLLTKKLYRRFGKLPVQWNGAKPELLPRDIPIYNSGVLGLHQSHQKLLRANAEFTHNLYQAFGKHNLGQLAWSYTLHHAGIEIHSMQDTLYHYWANPQAGLQILQSVFDKQSHTSKAEEYKAIRNFRFAVKKPRQHLPKRLEQSMRSLKLDLQHRLGL